MHLWFGTRNSKSNLKRFCACNVLRCDWLEGRFPTLPACVHMQPKRQPYPNTVCGRLYAKSHIHKALTLAPAHTHTRRSDAFHRQIESHRFQLCTSHTTNILIYARTIDLNNDDIMQYAVGERRMARPIVPAYRRCVGIWCDL